MSDDRFIAAITDLQVAVMARFDRIEERLSQISDDITVNIGRADRAHLSVDNARDEMRASSQELAELARKQRCLEAQAHDIIKPQ